MNTKDLLIGESDIYYLLQQTNEKLDTITALLVLVITGIIALVIIQTVKKNH